MKPYAVVLYKGPTALYASQWLPSLNERNDRVRTREGVLYCFEQESLIAEQFSDPERAVVFFDTEPEAIQFAEYQTQKYPQNTYIVMGASTVFEAPKITPIRKIYDPKKGLLPA